MRNPADETKKIYYTHFGINADPAHIKSEWAELDLALATGSDLMWISPELDDETWKHPEGKPLWDYLGGKERVSLSQPGVFAAGENPLLCFNSLSWARRSKITLPVIQGETAPKALVSDGRDFPLQKTQSFDDAEEYAAIVDVPAMGARVYYTEASADPEESIVLLLFFIKDRKELPLPNGNRLYPFQYFLDSSSSAFPTCSIRRAKYFMLNSPGTPYGLYNSYY